MFAVLCCLIVLCCIVSCVLLCYVDLGLVGSACVENFAKYNLAFLVKMNRFISSVVRDVFSLIV